ncbi:hypothetical protein [Streptomyces sp. NPDC005828]
MRIQKRLATAIAVAFGTTALALGAFAAFGAFGEQGPQSLVLAGNVLSCP